ncbi:xylitol dehydrogenase [Orobanche hederae]
MGSMLTERIEAQSDSEAILYVNGVRRVLPDGLAHFTLLEYLRGMHESLANLHGSQCWFCTPGFIMSIYALLRSSKRPSTEEDIKEIFARNLCQSTGYRPIIDAFRVFARIDDALYIIQSSGLSSSEFVCPSTGKPCSFGQDVKDDEGSTKRSICNSGIVKPISYSDTDGAAYTSKELIFPPELLMRKPTALCLTVSNGLKWHRPVSLQRVFDIKARYPNAKLVVGNTEVGVETRLKKFHYPVLVHVAHVPELNKLSIKEEGLEIGNS